MTDPQGLAQAVQAARQGDERAFEALFREYRHAIYSLVMHFLGDQELAADLTQDVFVRAWERMGTLREPAAFGGWLRTLAINLVRDHLRRAQQADPVDEAASIASKDESPSETAARRECQRTVRRAVLDLPEHQRTVVVMHHLEGKPVSEIMEDLGLPKGTVVSRLARARQALRRRLAPFIDEQEG